MPLIQLPELPATLLARYRALVKAAWRLPYTPSRLDLVPAVCTVRLAPINQYLSRPFLQVLFNDASDRPDDSRPICYIEERAPDGRVVAWCNLCAVGSKCDHLSDYLYELLEQLEPVASVSDDGARELPTAARVQLGHASPLRGMMSYLAPEPHDRVDGAVRLGLLVSEHSSSGTEATRLCVRPFTYTPTPYYGASWIQVDCDGGFESLSDADHRDLMLLCGIEPYRASPVMTPDQEAAFMRVAQRGALLPASSRFNGRFYATPDDMLEVGEPTEPVFRWQLAECQYLAVGFDRDCRSYFPILCGARAWMNPEGSNVYSPISGPASRMLAAWTNPEISYEDAEALSIDDAARLKEAGLPVPWKLSEAVPVNSVADRHIRFIITPNERAKPADVTNAMQPLVGHFTFNYGDISLPNEFARVIGDRAYERKGTTLYTFPTEEALGEIPRWPSGIGVVPGLFKRRGKGYAPSHARGQSERAAWLNAIEHLRSLGVDVVFERGAAITQPINYTNHLPDLTATEVGSRNVYEIGAPIEVAGESVDLIQMLAPVVRDPAFGALVVGDVPQDAAWAIDLPDGNVLSVPVIELQRLIAPLIEWLRESDNRRPRLSSLQVVAIGDAIRTEHSKKLEALRCGIARLVAEPNKNAKEPHGFEGDLRPYQLSGFDWLNRLHGAGFGGVLADDMGLGKTIQALAHILELHHTHGRDGGPALVVCPTSVAEQWEREAAKFVPCLRLLRIHGAGEARSALVDRVEDFDIIITTYAQALRDADAMSKHPFRLMILDEAQQVKNGKTQTARALRSIDAARTLVVTGTPIENNLGDLWAMFEFAMPGALGDETMFKRHFRNPIEKRGDSSAREMLARIVAPFILRRLKNQVAQELPAKTEEVLKVELAAPQRRLYEELRAASYLSVMSTIQVRGIEHSNIEILAALMKLRQSCDDPRLVKLESGRTVGASAKLDVLLDTLQEAVANGRHVLVFSCFTEMLDIVDDALTAAGVGHLKLTGATRNRQSLVDRFQTGNVPVFLLSLKAGGSGLNLTAADTVIHYDLWWNPAVEDQATDRAHRIGQNKPVLVYKLVCTDTLEEHILTMQARKAALAKAILDNDAAASVRFAIEDVEALLGVSTSRAAEPISTESPATRVVAKQDGRLPAALPSAPNEYPTPPDEAKIAHAASRLPNRRDLYAFWVRLRDHLTKHNPDVPAPLVRESPTVRMTAITKHVGVELRRQAQPPAIGIYICFWDARSFPTWQALQSNEKAFNAVAGHTWKFGRAPTDRIRWIALDRTMPRSDEEDEREAVEWLGKELGNVYGLVLPYVTASGTALSGQPN